MPKKYFIVLDTETINDARLVFDVGGIVMDRRGNVVDEFNFLVSEVVDSPLFGLNLAKDNFTKSKKDFYLSIMHDGAVEIDTLNSIYNYITATSEYYNNAPVVAYNARFDVDCLNAMSNYLLGHDFFIDIKVYDLWNMALNAICGTKKYINHALANGRVSAKGYVSTNAESVYQYLTDDSDFSEAHTALADAYIEGAILAQVFKTHKKMCTEMTGMPFRNSAWKTIQQKAEKM